MRRSLRFALATLLSLPALAAAQSGPATGTPGAAGPEGPPRWTVGAVAIQRDAPYRGLDEDLLVVPLVRFEGERAYLRGLRGGWRLHEGERFELAVFAQARLDGFDARDSAALAGMSDRRTSLDLGLAGTWRTAIGGFDLSLAQDALDRSGGQEASLTWATPFTTGDWGWLPAVSLRWQDADLVGYYYGVRPGEATLARPAYDPGSALLPEISLIVQRRLGERWTLYGRVGHTRLPGAIADSPIVAGDSSTSVMIGLGYSPRED